MIDHNKLRAVQSKRGRKNWVVVLEPDFELRVVVVVTVYPGEV